MQSIEMAVVYFPPPGFAWTDDSQNFVRDMAQTLDLNLSGFTWDTALTNGLALHGLVIKTPVKDRVLVRANDVLERIGNFLVSKFGGEFRVLCTNTEMPAEFVRIKDSLTDAVDMYRSYVLLANKTVDGLPSPGEWVNDASDALRALEG